jgi:hypothetical protein
MVSKGGVAAAKALDNHFDVTLVEKRATFNHNMYGTVRNQRIWK